MALHGPMGPRGPWVPMRLMGPMGPMRAMGGPCGPWDPCDPWAGEDTRAAHPMEPSLVPENAQFVSKSMIIACFTKLWQNLS